VPLEVGLSGSPLPLGLAISGGSCGFLSRITVPLLTCANRVHPLVRFRPLQSTALFSPPQIRRFKAPSLEFAFPLRDICHPRLVPRAILVCPVPCHPRRFSRPRWFTPRLALWVYFTPLPRPGFTLQGFRFLVRSRWRFHTTFAFSSFHPTPLQAVAHLLHFVRQRPQGFAPRPNLVPLSNGLGC